MHKLKKSSCAAVSRSETSPYKNIVWRGGVVVCMNMLQVITAMSKLNGMHAKTKLITIHVLMKGEM